jgi:branched-chain amino acid aminotransferase
MTTSDASQHASADPSIDWGGFGFGLNGVRTDTMWLDQVPVTDPPQDDNGSSPYTASVEKCLVPLGPLPLHPSATVLNYGQALFEGLKAFRRADGTIVMFRPNKNAQRMQQGAKRFFMPPVSVSTFVAAADATVRGNAKWVPPFGQGALYLRPLLMGTGEGLGVKPSTEVTFCIYCSPVGNYFKGGLKAIRLQAVKGFSRAACGGSGAIKASGNYAPAFQVQKQVRERGYDEVLCLDAVSGEAVEEAGASNFFAVFDGNRVVTPSLETQTILPGVTRASVIELLQKECGCTVEERRLTLSDLKNASEAFCCGTGASITPVGSVSVANQEGIEDESAQVTFGDGSTPGSLTQKIYKMLLDLQTGVDVQLNEKYREWIHVVEP